MSKFTWSELAIGREYTSILRRGHWLSSPWAHLRFILIFSWRPVYAIAQGFARAHEYRERPQPRISSEHLVEIIDSTYVKHTLILLTLLLKVLNGCLVGEHDVDMETQEESHEATD